MHGKVALHPLKKKKLELWCQDPAHHVVLVGFGELKCRAAEKNSCMFMFTETSLKNAVYQFALAPPTKKKI